MTVIIHVVCHAHMAKGLFVIVRESGGVTYVSVLLTNSALIGGGLFNNAV